MLRKSRPLGLLLIFLLTPLSSFAKSFESSYLKFDIPNDWECLNRKTYYYCKSTNPKIAKEALIILTAKQVGPEDTYEVISKNLNKPKTITGPQGLAIQSKVYETSYVTINNHRWVKSIHINSENQDYYTYYLATLNSGLSILFTLSLNLNYVKNHQSIINSIFTTLKLKKVNLGPQQQATPLIGGDDALIAETEQEVYQENKLPFGLNQSTLIILVALIAGVILLISSFSPTKKKRKKRRRK